MSKSFLKIICLITIFSVTIAFIVGSISMLRSTEYLTAEIEGKILSTAEKYSHDFSSKFNHMEGLTDSLFAYVSTTFDEASFERDPSGYLHQYKEELARMIKKTLSTVDTAHSLYVTFNPELTPENDEVWYAFLDGKIRRIPVDFNSNKRNFELPYADNMAYFFEPQGKSCGTWCGPYFDQDLDEDVFSYSRAIYVNDRFIGVAGADITACDMVEVVENMKLYDSGYSALLDENFAYILYPNEHPTEEQLNIPTKLQKRLEREIAPASGTMRYSLEGTDKILGYSQLDNGWTLIITQPQAEAFSPIHSLGIALCILAVLLALVLIAALSCFSIPLLKKQSSLEEENREKEILLVYQSRQAKIGEMTGNITHQWKQPLNTINLILANLLDSYHFGDLDERKLQKSVSKVETIVERMSETITDFSDFLKPSKEKIAFDSRQCIKSAISLMEESINKEQISVKQFYDGDTFGFGYPNELTHVIFNLLTNARDAIVSAAPPVRTITIQTRRKQEQLDILIINEGDPIEADILECLFEPYFTTKSETKGTGLGLYISREIVEQRMDGKLFIENIPGGVQCRIELPAGGDSPESGKEAFKLCPNDEAGLPEKRNQKENYGKI